MMGSKSPPKLLSVCLSVCLLSADLVDLFSRFFLLPTAHAMRPMRCAGIEQREPSTQLQRVQIHQDLLLQADRVSLTTRTHRLLGYRAFPIR